MDVVAKIKEVLDSVRPMLQADGGDVRFVSYENNIVHVELQGACGSCPMSTFTLKNRIEADIIAAIPEVKSVENIM